jgi:TetR/AcrR family transcriptional repressor of nem operon
MRKSREESSKTRAHIVATAAREFRRNGIAATGLNGLMSAAGLTHGGFYKHFSSKEQLVAEACQSIMISVIDALTERTRHEPPAERLAFFVNSYVSKQHRDNAEAGCGFASLGTELSRCSSETRDATSVGYRHLVQTLAGFFPDPDASDVLAKAQTLAVGMSGAIMLARAVGDAELSDQIIENTARTLLAAI